LKTAWKNYQKRETRKPYPIFTYNMNNNAENNRKAFGEGMGSLWLSMQLTETTMSTVTSNKRSFGEQMAALWAENLKGGQPSATVTPQPIRSLIGYQSSNEDVIQNDDESRAHIVMLLKAQGITHKPTLDNLVFDYLNTPKSIRDALIEANIGQVKEQITVREEQIKAQAQAGHSVASIDDVQGDKTKHRSEYLENRFE
jgi:hypothetical protein